MFTMHGDAQSFVTIDIILYQKAHVEDRSGVGSCFHKTGVLVHGQQSGGTSRLVQLASDCGESNTSTMRTNSELLDCNSANTC